MPSFNDIIVKVGLNVEEFISGSAKLGKELEGIASAVDKNFSGIDKIGARFSDWGKDLTAAITLPLAGLGALATKAAVDFDDASDRIRAKTGATGDALAGLNDVFKNVFSSIPTSARDASEAISALSSRLGLAGQPLQDLATQELNLARITEESLNPLIAATTRLFGDWSIATEKQAGSLDFLLRVSQGTGVSVTKLSELMVEFGAPMRALGFDLETAAVMLGRFEKEGVNIGTIMPGLRMAIKQFAGAGLEGAAAFQSFVDVVKKSDDAQATMIAKTVSGGRAFVDMFRAIKEGRFDLDEMTKKFKESGDTINKAAADTLSFTDKLVLFKNKLQTALEPIGTKLTGIFEKALDGAGPFLAKINELADAFAKLSPSTQAWILGITAFTAAIGPALIAIGGMASGVAALAPAFALTVAGMTGLAGAVTNVASAVAGNMTGALTAGETVILRMGQAALLAAAAFAGWKLGEWAYNNIPGLKALGDWVSDLILKIPLLGGVVKSLTGITTAEQGLRDVASDTAFVNQKLEDSLKRIGITVDKTGLSAEQYGAKLREAAKGVTTHGVAVEAAAPKVKGMSVDLDVLTKNHEKAAKATKVHQQSLTDWYISANKFLDTLIGPKNLANEMEMFNDKLMEAFRPEAWLDKIKTRLDAAIQGMVRGIPEQSAQVASALKSMLEDATESVLPTIAAANKLLSGFGVMSQTEAAQTKAGIEAERKEIEDIYKSSNNRILEYALVNAAQMAAVNIKAGEDQIALARKTGQDVTDAQIDALRKQKLAFTNAHMDIEQAYKTLNVTTTQHYDDELKTAQTAYGLIVKSKLSSNQDILKAGADLYSAELAAQQAHGDAITETQKRQLEKQVKIAHEGAQTLAKEWDLFANHIGDAVGKGLDELANDLLTGKKIGNIKDIFSKIWADIAQSFVKDMIHPMTAAIGTFITGTLKALIGGEGFGGVIDAAKKAGKAITDVFGGGASAASAATGTAGGVASAGGGAASAASSASGIMGIANVVTGAISAISSVIGNFQFAHMNTALGRIEVNTREMSTVMWQTGAESIQGILKTLQNLTLQVIDRLVDVRSALFDPVAKDLEDIYKLLQSGTAIARGTQEATEETAVWAGNVNDSVEQVSNDVVEAGRAHASETAAVATAVQASADSTAQAIADTSASATAAAESIAGSVTTSGNEVINALGQTGAEAIAAQHQDTQALLQSLGMLGSDLTAASTITGNAYSDLKSTIKGVSAQSLADQQAAYARLAAQVAASASIGMTPLELAGLVDPNGAYIPQDNGKTYDYAGPGQYTGALADMVTRPGVGVFGPTGNGVGGVGGFANLNITPPGGYYAPPSPYTSPTNSPSFVQGGSVLNADRQTAPKQVNVNFYGPVTDRDYANRIAQDAARNLVQAGL